MAETRKKSKPVKKTSTKKVEESVATNSTITQGGTMKDKMVPFLVALVVIGAFAVGLLYGKVSVYEKAGSAVANREGSDAQPAVQAQPAAPEVTTLSDDQWEEVIANPVAVRGEDAAPVKMVEFTDYQCPFCKRYFEDSYGQILENFVENGQVQYIVRDMPLGFHQNAKAAAEAARCAGDQDQYFAMHDALYENQEAWSNASDPTEAFEGYAADLGLNTSSFSSCLTSGTYSDAVDEEIALANKVGATGTPTFFINGEKIVGAQPYSVFESTINAQL